MTFDEKIKSINKLSATSKLVKLEDAGTDSADTIADFWDNIVEPMLPDYDTMKKWHNLLVKYVSLPETVFMLRRAHDEAPAYKQTVPADALRRGFLTKTDSKYWFVFNDNAFATYILAMVLDGDVIDTLKAEDLLKYLQTPNSTIRFHRSGKGGVEQARAYYKISGAQPQISPYGYTVAHIFDVNDHYYDANLGFDNTRGDEALKSINVQIDRGMYSDYTFQGTVAGKQLYYRDGYHVGCGAREFLRAHMLRFLHPLNYFCAPKDNMNGSVYCEFTDHIHTHSGKRTNRRFHRISGYEHLLYYAHHKFKEKYGDIYDEYLEMIMLPQNTFDFFEKCSAGETTDFYGSEFIDVKYGNPLSCSSGTTVHLVSKPAGPKNLIDLNNINYAYLDTFKVGEIVNQVLRAIIENGVKTGKITKSEIAKFKTEKGKRTSTFMVPKPLLALDRLDSNGYARYYEEPISCYGETLFLYKDWDKKDLEIKNKLINWIIDWKAANGSII